MSSPDTSAVPTERAVEVLTAAAPYLEHWLEVQRLRARVPALQAAVRVGGRLVLSAALGAADVATGEPLTPAHRFRVASHSKTFTATLVLQLFEAGRLRLDDPLERWVPRIAETAPALGGVTVRALLGHQGGVVRDGRDGDHWQRAHPFPADLDGLLGLAHDGAVLGSDERFKYSNVAYGLLGQVVEAAGGASWAEQLRRRITVPLGLGSTLPDLGSVGPDGRAAGHATGYGALLDDEVERLPVPATTTGVLAAATGVSSTAEDLTAWMSAHAHGATVLAPGTQRLAQREESRIRSRDGAVRRWGLAFEIGEVGSRTLVGHSGGFPGFVTRTWLDPAADVAVSVLTSCNGSPADALAAGLLRLADVALAGPDGQGGPQARGGADPGAADPGGGTAGGARADDASGGDGSGGGLERWTGRFANLGGRTDVALLGGRLVLVAPAAPDPGEGWLGLVPEGPDALRSEAVDGTGPVGEAVEYAWADDGSPASVRVGGVTSWPVADFLARRAAMLGAPAHPPAEPSTTGC